MGNKLYDFTKDEINEYLVILSNCLNEGNYIISKQGNRVKNNNFMIRNNISDAKAIEIIKSLTVNDFCYAMENDNDDPKYCDEILYLFCKEIEHDVRGRLVQLDIFIKVNVVEENELAIIVSFHNFDRDRNGNIPYLF